MMIKHFDIRLLEQAKKLLDDRFSFLRCQVYPCQSDGPQGTHEREMDGKHRVLQGDWQGRYLALLAKEVNLGPSTFLDFTISCARAREALVSNSGKEKAG